MTQQAHEPRMDNLDFLSLANQMGALIKQQNWQASSLGPPKHWPALLKTMVGTLLRNPQPMIMAWGPDFLSFFNDSYLPLLSEPFDGSFGQPAAALWTNAWPALAPEVQRAFAGEGVHLEDMPLSLSRSSTLQATWWALTFIPFCDERGSVVGVYCLPVETTENVLAAQRKAAADKQQRFRAALGEALRCAAGPDALLAVMARMLGQHLAADCVGYGEVDAAGEQFHIHQDWTAGAAPELVGTHRLLDFGPGVVAALKQGRTVAVNDTASDPLIGNVAHRAAYLSLGKGAFIDAPLIRNGRLAAVLFVVNARPHLWTASDKALVEEVAERAWASLQRMHAERDLQAMNQALDHRTSELTQLEDVLRHSQKLDALGQLTGSVAHDFNNLLGVISFCIQLVRNREVPEQERARYMDQIFETAERATKLTAQLLAFTRQEPFCPEVFDVMLQVHSVVELLRPLMGAAVHLQLEHPEHPEHPEGAEGAERVSWLARADISQFETALVNLAVNARDAMQARGTLTITVALLASAPATGAAPSSAQPWVAVSVRDSGCGIAAEQLEAIFEPFYTTKAPGKGTGLGLSQVLGFARQSGGDVQVQSAPSQGTVFTLCLPRAQA